MAVTTCSFRVDRRARIFEIRPRSSSASSDGSDPSGHRAAPPLRCWTAHDGLCSLRIICKSASCVKLTCVINTDHVGISHVTGSSYFVRALHEVVNIMVRDALLGMCAVPCICVACVEKCMLCV